MSCEHHLVMFNHRCYSSCPQGTYETEDYGYISLVLLFETVFLFFSCIFLDVRNAILLVQLAMVHRKVNAFCAKTIYSL